MEPLTSKRLIVLAGPTAVGKTAVAIALAQHLDTEIISCDSRQVYQELNIGVARPDDAELAAVKHHFIATKSIHDSYSAGQYALEVNELLPQLFEKYETVILTGGTGLYIKAVVDGLNYKNTENLELRNELKAILESEGLEALQAKAKLSGIDESYHSFNNPQRLIRAIELAVAKEKGLLRYETKKPSEYEISSFYLNRDRSTLYQRINERVDLMIANGLEEEAKKLYPYRNLNALRTVGYNELFAYFDGQWTKEQAIEKIKQKTRNYAKRQLTWFRNQGDFTEVQPSVESVLGLL